MKNRNLSHSDNWATPPEFYNKLDREFHFDFDPCPLNHDVNEWDGLNCVWPGDTIFLNPPYSRKLKESFIVEAVAEAKVNSKTIVSLLPVSTSTKLFHQTIKPCSREIRFIEGRIPFIGTNQYDQKVNWHLWGKDNNEKIEIIKKGVKMEVPLHIKQSGQHDSMVVIF